MPTARTLDPAVADDLGKLMLELSHNKKSRRALGRLIKEVLPDSPHAAAFSDVDVEDRFESFRAEQDAKELERQQTAALARMNQQRAGLLTGSAGRTYSEEDVGKIEALMQKKGLTDYEDAAVLYAHTLPPENPQPSNLGAQHGTTWEIPEFAKFGHDPVRASRETANQMITDFMRKR